MGSFTPNDLKAIKWFFENNPQYKAQLTYYPVVTYTDGGKTVEKPVSTIRRQWEKQRKNKDSRSA